MVLAGATPATAAPTAQVFSYTGAAQSFTVPANVCSVQVSAQGGSGGTSGSTAGGLGGTVGATIAVTPGEVLTVLAGGSGATPTGTSTMSSTGGAGGFNGGGKGGNGNTPGAAGMFGGGGGGGASEVDRAGGRLVVASGGGGGGGTSNNGDQTGGAGGSGSQSGASGGNGFGLTSSAGASGGTGGTGGTGSAVALNGASRQWRAAAAPAAIRRFPRRRCPAAVAVVAARSVGVAAVDPTMRFDSAGGGGGGSSSVIPAATAVTFGTADAGGTGTVTFTYEADPVGMCPSAAGDAGHADRDRPVLRRLSRGRARAALRSTGLQGGGDGR